MKDDPRPPDGQRPDLPSGSDEGRPGPKPEPPAIGPVTEPDDEGYDADHFEDL